MEIPVHVRRAVVWGSMGTVGFALALALLVTALAVQSAPVWLYVALGLTVLAVAALVAILVLERRPRPEAVAGPPAHAAPSHREASVLESTPAPSRVEDLLLRCSRCSETFTTADDGRRPLETLCPYCGQRGILD